MAFSSRPLKISPQNAKNRSKFDCSGQKLLQQNQFSLSLRPRRRFSTLIPFGRNSWLLHGIQRFTQKMAYASSEVLTVVANSKQFVADLAALETRRINYVDVILKWFNNVDTRIDDVKE
jgi:hypothetical protein